MSEKQSYEDLRQLTLKWVNRHPDSRDGIPLIIKDMKPVFRDHSYPLLKIFAEYIEENHAQQTPQPQQD